MIEPLFPIIHPITLDGTRSRIETGVSSSSFIFSCSSRTASTAMDFRSLDDYKINILHDNSICMIKEQHMFNIQNRNRLLHAEYGVDKMGVNKIHQLVNQA